MKSYHALEDLLHDVAMFGSAIVHHRQLVMLCGMGRKKLGVRSRRKIMQLWRDLYQGPLYYGRYSGDFYTLSVMNFSEFGEEGRQTFDDDDDV